MRYAYAITAALLAGGATATLSLQQPVGAQTAQNEPGAIVAQAPRANAPMSFADMAAKLQPAVVNISTTQRVKVPQQQQNPFAGTPFGDLFRQFGGPGGPGGGGGGATPDGPPATREAQSLGSGFLISADGFVVTNNHVIQGGDPSRGISATVEEITVTLPDRREFKARVVGRDVASDLAVLKIEATALPFVKFGDSKSARVGDWVVAIGNPFGLGGTVTAGIVSALHRGISGGGAYDRYIQTDASINQGNSGGPMFDLNGNVIGINNAIYSPTGGNVGIGFAIPAEEARPVVEALRRGEKIRRGYLGIQIQPIDDAIASSLGLPKNVGEIIARVEPGQAAARAGIRQGDVIVKVNGKDVTPDDTLSYIVANTAVGTRVPVELIRDGKRQTLTATIGERPPEDVLAGGTDMPTTPGDEIAPGAAGASTRAAIGFDVTPMTAALSRQLGLETPVRGVVVTQVDASSDAASNGIARGDIIMSINQRPTATAADLAAGIAAARAAGRDSVLLLIQLRRQGQTVTRYIGVNLAAG